MSGRLDSNQRPPEPHSDGPGRENRKNRRFLNLRIPYFPYFTLRNPHFPQIPPSFLPFPSRGIRPCRAPEPVRGAPGAISGELPRMSAGGSIPRSMSAEQIGGIAVCAEVWLSEALPIAASGGGRHLNSCSCSLSKALPGLCGGRSAHPACHSCLGRRVP